MYPQEAGTGTKGLETRYDRRGLVLEQCMEEEEEYKVSLKYNQENLMHRHHNLTLVQALSCWAGEGDELEETIHPRYTSAPSSATVSCVNLTELPREAEIPRLCGSERALL